MEKFTELEEQDKQNCIGHNIFSMSEVRRSVFQEAQLLFACAIKGGMLGIYMEEGMPLYFISDELLEALNYTREQFSAAYQKGFMDVIHPDDRASCSAAAQTAIESNGIYEKVCRMRSVDGSYTWRRNLGKHIKSIDGRDVILILSMDISEILEYQRRMEEKAYLYEAKSRQLELMASNIPGGICEVVPDQYYTLLYGNEGFYNLYGYTKEQFLMEHSNRMQEVIYEPDRDMVRRTVDEAYSKDKESSFQFEHRIIQRDGNIVWALIRGRFTEYQKSYMLNCVIIDITSRKKTEDEARINERRFRLALEKTDSTLFEYDIETHVMIHGDKSAEQYGIQHYTENVPWKLLELGIVHSDTKEAFLDMYRKICAGEESANCIVKVRLTDESYVWRKINMTTIYDENGKAVQAIGILEDIDAQVRREEKLRYQSERDTLTNSYNRGAMVRLIDHQLPRSENKFSSIFILDIDSFKHVNDSHGHLYGDFVLIETVNRLVKVLGLQAVIGRIGGDEFIIFLSELISLDLVEEIAQRVLSVFHEVYCYKGIDSKVHGSIGVAVYPKDGNTFEELYQNADIALYRAKNEGKNKAVFYSADMKMDGDWVLYSRKVIDK